MKKIILAFIGGFSALAGSGQTATNFNSTDCAGNPHDLFSELDAGKVIVITWVMPCPGCINAATAAASTTQGYAATNPGRVFFYMVDDYGNSTCSALATWANNNGIVPDAMFSDAAISMADYGAPGMPKTVVIGGGAHNVFYNMGGDITVSVLQTAIDSALHAPAGIPQVAPSVFSLNVSPNPGRDNNVMLDYSLTRNENVTVTVYNMLGEAVSNVTFAQQLTGRHQARLDLSTMGAGVYFIRLHADEGTQTYRWVKAN